MKYSIPDTVALAFVALVGIPGTLIAIPSEVDAQELHRLPLSSENVHWGFYDGAIPPVLTIASGDRVYFENLLARGLERPRSLGMSESRFLPSMLEVEARETERGGSHPLTGPIHVRGARPGHVLEVRFEEIGFLAPFGVAAFRPGGGALPDDFDTPGLRAFEIDTVDATATMTGVPGVTIPVRPFFGSIGVAPPLSEGRINSTAPGRHAGNLDNRELVAGSTLYLPVHVDGGMLSIGDGHAAQGNGEVSGTAIESSLFGTIVVVLRTDLSLEWPRAETPTHYVSMGLDPDLDVAAQVATREMIAWLVEERGMTTGDAYVLCSVALDLRVTQLVDGTKGIHGMLAKSLFGQDMPSR